MLWYGKLINEIQRKTKALNELTQKEIPTSNVDMWIHANEIHWYSDKTSSTQIINDHQIELILKEPIA